MIRALICDDSTLMRALLREALQAEGDIEVVGMATDPYEARELIKSLSPDVLTLDIEMPRMDGVSFLEKIMRLRPMPVVMVSSLAASGADITLAALELGAIAALRKPIGARDAEVERFAAELRELVRAAARAGVREVVRRDASRRAAARSDGHGPAAASGAILALAASTGGVEALRHVLSRLPAGMPPIAIVQHMPAEFTPRFAERLNHVTPHRVMEAEDGLRLATGDCVIAPGGRHLEIAREGSAYVCRLRDGAPVSGHRPSADVLFSSLAESAGRRAVAAILTGMGRDGAEGLQALRATDAHTLGQDETSCLIYGMPRAAKAIGAVAQELPLDALPEAILAAFAAAVTHHDAPRASATL